MRQIIFLLMLLLSTAICNAQDKIKWLDPANNKDFSINGLAWFEQNNHKYIRLPLAEANNVPAEPWKQSLCPASARIRFKTNSTSLRVKVDHGLTPKLWTNMSPISYSGIDLYVGASGNMSFWETTRPPGKAEYECTYFENQAATMREFTLYLPTYTPLANLKIGVDAGAKIEKATEYQFKKPIVFYGTSITQGGAAGKGSDNYVSSIGRTLNCDMINLGFSGSAKGEPIMAELMSQIDASIYVVDCVANMTPNLMNERYEKFVRILHKNKPNVPIVLMTKAHYSQEIEPNEAAEYCARNKPVFETYKKLSAEGNISIFLFDTGEIIPAGGDHPSVDGHHLTAKGFYMIADKLTPLLKQILISKDKL